MVTPTREMMKLHYSSASPFVRKVVASAIELGVRDRILLMPTENPTMPTARNPAVALDNPLSKVPVLVLPDGDCLYDSIVICEYLDTLDGGHRLFPAAGMERWGALRLNALADGIMEAGVAIRLERVRAVEKRWSEWIDGHLFKIDAALDKLEADFDNWHSALTIGHIALACALQWLDFREISPAFHRGRPRVYAWHEDILERPSLMASAPA